MKKLFLGIFICLFLFALIPVDIPPPPKTPYEEPRIMETSQEEIETQDALVELQQIKQAIDGYIAEDQGKNQNNSPSFEIEGEAYAEKILDLAGQLQYKAEQLQNASYIESTSGYHHTIKEYTDFAKRVQRRYR